MARSDLLVSLVRAGVSGDNRELASTAEALIAEERARQHNILADRLEQALRSNGGPGRSGMDWEDNFQLLCQSCNSIKGPRTMEEARAAVIAQGGMNPNGIKL